MGGVISKRELAAIGKRERTGGFDRPTQPVKPNVAGVLVYNASGAAIPAGGALVVSGFVSSLTYAEAQRRALNGEIILNGTAATASATAATVATALEPIPAGSCGRCAFPVTYSPVTISDDSYTYADASLTAVESGGVWQIVAKSTTTSGAAFCALVKLTGGSSGGGGSSYTLETTTQSVLTFPSNTLDVITGIAVSNNTLTVTTSTVYVIVSGETVSVIKTAELVES